MKQHRLKRIALLLLLVSLCVIFSGCEGNIYLKSEIEKAAFVTLVAIDKAPDSDQVMISTCAELAAMGGGSEGQTSSFNAFVETSEGSTVFECLRNMSTWTGKELYFGHVGYIIIGEEAARNGILQYLDLFARDHEMSMDVKILVAKGTTGKEVFEKANPKDMYIADRLDNLLDNASAQSISGSIKLYKFLGNIESTTADPYLPYITLEKHTKRINSDDESMNMHLAGYAAFRSDKLIGFLDEQQSRGLNWVADNVTTGVIVLQYGNAGNISMEITKSKVKITPKLENDTLSADVHVSFSSNVGEIMSTVSIFHKQDLANVNKLQNDRVRAEVESIIQYSQENAVDLIQIGDAFTHKYPVKSVNYQSEWDKYFSSTKITVRVDSKISRSYNLHEPITRKGGE